MLGTVIYLFSPPHPQYYLYSPVCIMEGAADNPAPKTNRDSQKDTRQQERDTQQEKAPRLKNQRRRAPRRKKRGLPKKKNQDPERNVLTNIGNQLMSYLLSKRKSCWMLDRVKSGRNPDWQQTFYRTLNKIKLKFSGHYNLHKLRELWFGEPCEGCDEEFRRVLRIMSDRYIQTKLVCSLLTSKKLSHSLKESHLRYRRRIIRELRSPVPLPADQHSQDC